MAVSSAQLAAFRTRTRDLHNYLRKKRNGRTMLVLDSRLNATALKAAQLQASRNAMQHTNYYCTTFCTGCSTSNPSCTKAVGENVAGNWSTADSVVLQGWRNSCRHYYNMVNGGFNLMGVGVADSSTGVRYWAVHFAGKASYCAGKGCPSSNSYCCACQSTGAWKTGDVWRCPGGSQGCP